MIARIARFILTFPKRWGFVPTALVACVIITILMLLKPDNSAPDYDPTAFYTWWPSGKPEEQVMALTTASDNKIANSIQEIPRPPTAEIIDTSLTDEHSPTKVELNDEKTCNTSVVQPPVEKPDEHERIVTGQTFLSTAKELKEYCDNSCLTFLGSDEKHGLGNLMFLYASVLGLAEKSKRKMVVLHPTYYGYASAFPNLSARRAIADFSTFKTINGTLRAKYMFANLRTSLNSDDNNIAIDGYLQSYRYFIKIAKRIQDEFEFSHKLQKRARAAIAQSLAVHKLKPKQVTLVGIHIRRGDLLCQHLRLYGMMTATESYLKTAITRANSTIYALEDNMDRPIVFLVLGHDPEWFQKNVAQELAKQGQKHIFVRIGDRTNPAFDMCVLTLCDHVIMTVGTFGWWSAFLNPGLKFYQKHAFRINTQYAKEFNATDHFPAEWIGI